MGEPEFEGGCLCAATRFRVSGKAANPCYCHCRSCRLAAGAPCVAWATFPAEGFRLVQGELARYRSSPKVLRTFCSSCGTAISYEHEARPGELDVTLATLDDATGLEPRFHIWVSNKPAWVTLADDLPRYDELPEGAG